MANFTETQIHKMLTELKDEFGSEIATRELALLELEDMERKGCTLEYACKFNGCHGCSIAAKCPVVDWEKRHPEYANDALAMKIRVLEAGGEEAYMAKLKAQEEAKKKAEEEKNRAKDEDRIDAACKTLQIIRDSKQPISALMINEVVDLIRNTKTTKLELDAAIQKLSS
jgi:hypothetical protein